MCISLVFHRNLTYTILSKNSRFILFCVSQNKNYILIVPAQSSGPPVIVPVGRSKILENVKRFLPELAAAEVDLKKRLESGENLDIEECESKSGSQLNLF